MNLGFGFYTLHCGGVVMSLSVNIQRLPGSQGKSDAILGKEIKREEGELVAGGVFSLYYHFLNREDFWTVFSISLLFVLYFHSTPPTGGVESTS